VCWKRHCWPQSPSPCSARDSGGCVGLRRSDATRTGSRKDCRQSPGKRAANSGRTAEAEHHLVKRDSGESRTSDRGCNRDLGVVPLAGMVPGVPTTPMLLVVDEGDVSVT